MRLHIIKDMLTIPHNGCRLKRKVENNYYQQRVNATAIRLFNKEITQINNFDLIIIKLIIVNMYMMILLYVTTLKIFK